MSALEITAEPNGSKPKKEEKGNDKNKKKKTGKKESGQTKSGGRKTSEEKEKDNLSKEQEPRKEFKKNKKGNSTVLPVQSPTPVDDNDSLIRAVFDKTKHKLNKSSMQSVPTSRRMEEAIICPEEISTHVDTQPDYVEGDEKTAMEFFAVKNYDNDGNLFVNGVPFWMLRDEPIQIPPYVTIIQTLKDIIEGKIKMLEGETRPRDLDINHDLEVLKSRDYEYFNKPNRLLSNTVNGIINTKIQKQKKTKRDKMQELYDREEERANDETNEYNFKVRFKPCEKLCTYDRKHLSVTMNVESFTPGVRKLKSKTNSLNGKSQINIKTKKKPNSIVAKVK